MRVFDSEVVPLGEALGAVVILEVEVVLERACLRYFPEVATFEPRLKDQCLVGRQVNLGTIVVAGRAHLAARCIVFSSRQRALLVVRVFLHFRVHSVVRLQLLVVSVEARTTYPLPLLGNLRLRLVGVDLPEVVVLLQAVRQVLRIEVVTLLVWLVDRAVALVLWMRQLDYVLLVDVG